MKTALLAGGWMIVSAFWSASTPQDEALRNVQDGNRAFDRGDYARALAQYDSAAYWIDDPGLVSFNKGVACYRLGHYRDAETQFTRAIEQAPSEREAAARYNLANALVLESRGLDIALLKRAIQNYEQCLRLWRGQKQYEQAHKNLQLARSLFTRAQVTQQKHKTSGSSKPADVQENALRSRPMSDGPAGENRGLVDSSSSEQVPMPRTGDRSETRQTPRPGAGNLPLVPDSDRLAPMSAAASTAYLETVAQRILSERRLRQAQGVPPDVRSLDW